MALSAGPETQRGKLVIRNIGLMLSGALEAPIVDADTIVAEGGRITAFGKHADLDTDDARVNIDAHGCALSPGLIDSHVHPVFGDWTPRQGQLGWIESSLHGGVTTMISAGEVHLPGRPRDIVGLKAMAITAQTRLLELPVGWRESARRRTGARAGHGRERFRRTRRRRRHLARRGRAWLGQSRLSGERDGRLGAAGRHPEHHPHRRPERARVGIHRRRHRAGSRRRHHRSHQWRPHRAAAAPDTLPVRRLRAWHRDCAQRQ